MSGLKADSSYAACQDADRDRTSYAKHWAYAPGGALPAIRWENLEPNHCGGQPWCGTPPDVLQNMWANKATSWALEFYPDNHGTYHIVVTNLTTGQTLGVDRTLSSSTGTDRLDIDPSGFCFGLGVAFVPYTSRRVC